MTEPRRPPALRLGLLFAGATLVAAATILALPFLLEGMSAATPIALAASAIVLGLAGVLWLAVSRLLLVPAKRLAATAPLLAQQAAPSLTPGDYGTLAPLASAMADLAGRMAALKADRERAVLDATRRADEQSDRLAALLRDLHEGVLVCNLRHQVLLYNAAARQLLAPPGPGTGGELGLGRTLPTLLTREPVLHTLERLTRRVRDGRHVDHASGTTASFVAGTADGRLLQARMALILAAEQEITGYVVTLEDVTGELALLARRDALLRAATEDVRQPLANLCAAAETLAEHGGLAPEERVEFDGVVIDSARQLTESLERITTEYRAGLAAAWPMADVYSAPLFALVSARAATEQLTATPTGLPFWLHGDSYGLVLLLSHLMGRIARANGQRTFDLSAEPDPQGRFVYVDIAWQGRTLGNATLDRWRNDALVDALAGLTVGDILDHHRADLWSEPGRDGTAKLRLPLPPARERHGRRREMSQARPEFFDFDLLTQPLPEGELARTPLRHLAFVVFDCETTGLMPSQGDELVQIAGVRIVNGRILTGETFESLVNPGRPIPAESMAIHGISDAMVADAPTPVQVLPGFRAFVGDAVLVAHNAAFDLKFLKMKQRAAGVRFDMPVLDTMVLSRQIQGEDGEHSLDGIARRLGLDIVDRHSAMGDALLTAAVFLRFCDMLAERGIVTLDDAVRRSNMAVELVARERAF